MMDTHPWEIPIPELRTTAPLEIDNPEANAIVTQFSDEAKLKMEVIQSLLEPCDHKTYGERLKEAADKLGKSVRTVERLVKKWEKDGLTGSSPATRGTSFWNHYQTGLSSIRENLLHDYNRWNLYVAVISADVMLKIIVGHFWGDRDDYMTTGLPGINSCIPDRVIVSDYGSSPRGGNFRLSEKNLVSASESGKLLTKEWLNEKRWLAE